jgi:thiol-disulfide isomerase/thioredoxin
MKIRLILTCLLLAGRLHAQDAPPPPLSEVDAAMESLFAEHDDNQSLDKAIARAREAGLDELVILDARYYDAISRKNIPLLEALAPELDKAAVNFDREKAINFTKPDEYRALAAHSRALVAESRGDKEAFRKELLDAVWLSPENATLFLENLMEIRRKESLANMKVDLTLSLEREGGEPTTLAAALGGHQMIVLDFWASWCGPCMQAMEDLERKAAWLNKYNIAMATVNLDRDNQKEEAARIRKKFPVDIPWFLEPETSPLSVPLEIDSIPRFVVIKPDGSLVFNGHPDDPDFLASLRKVMPALPDINGDLPPGVDVPSVGTDTVPIPGETPGVEIRPAQPVEPPSSNP